VSGAGESDYKWTYGVRVIAKQIDRATWRNTLTYRFHPRFTAGVEYNPLAGKVSPLANLVVVTETHQRPAVIVELMDREGEMLRSKAAKSYARRHGFPVITIAELVAYRAEVERAAA